MGGVNFCDFCGLMAHGEGVVKLSCLMVCQFLGLMFGLTSQRLASVLARSVGLLPTVRCG